MKTLNVNRDVWYYIKHLDKNGHVSYIFHPSCARYIKGAVSGFVVGWRSKEEAEKALLGVQKDAFGGELSIVKVVITEKYI